MSKIISNDSYLDLQATNIAHSVMHEIPEIKSVHSRAKKKMLIFVDNT